MRMKKWIWMATVCLVLPVGAWAQASNETLVAQMHKRGMSQGRASNENVVSNAARRIVERYGGFLVATVKEMPADKYGYHPTPAQMTFGQVAAHIAESNVFLCSKLSDVPPPKGEKVSASDSKEKLVAAVQASFDYCKESMAKLEDSQLGEPVTLFGGRTGQRVDALFGLTGDLHDHYAALSVYVRLNGLLPPSAQRKHM
jgi:DinB superfamily